MPAPTDEPEVAMIDPLAGVMLQNLTDQVLTAAVREIAGRTGISTLTAAMALQNGLLNTFSALDEKATVAYYREIAGMVEAGRVSMETLMRQNEALRVVCLPFFAAYRRAQAAAAVARLAGAEVLGNG